MLGYLKDNITVKNDVFMPNDDAITTEIDGLIGLNGRS